MVATELWKEISGYEGRYAVSTSGRVISLLYGMDVRKKTDKWGYHAVALNFNGKKRSFFVHRLVAMAFIDGATEKRNQVNHKDGKKTNNNADNLEWVSCKENVAHALSTGLANNGRITRPKLTEDQVIAIRQSLQPTSFLKALYGVGEGCIQSVRSRKSWKHL